MIRPKLVDLFCGTGGFSLGAHRAGFEVTTAIDIDQTLTSSFSRNFGQTTLLNRDVSTLTGQQLIQYAGHEIDGIFGGPPCQGFSAMGHRNSEDPRRELLGHFFRLVAEVRPSFFVMENVVGLSYPDAKPVLEEALSLVTSNYEIVGPVVLDAAEYGAATKRRRLFVIGYDRARCDDLTTADFLGARRPAATVADAIEDLRHAREIGHTDGFDIWQLPPEVVPNRYRDALLTADRRFTGHRPTLHTDEVTARFKNVPMGGIDKVGRHPRLAWDGQCPTLRAGTGSDRGSFQSVRPIHPDLPRVITVREAARLQGFPDSFVFHPTVWHSFRMIGNSVSPIISEAIFSTLRSKLYRGHGSSIAAE
ncbi:DNA cytosine methyltransferase [Rhizobium sp. R86522]|uniref:DNA cytosine methyltransferase n=1 Tax=Rhizobium sp. R86522 TaxID=3093861 RepID=UPI0036715E22